MNDETQTTERPVKTTFGEPQTTYKVAAWWRSEGYGGGAVCQSPEQAAETAREMIAQGYGDGSRGGGDEVRVRKITIEVWTVKRDG